MGIVPNSDARGCAYAGVTYTYDGDGKGKRIARRDSSGTVSYYFADHLATARVVTGATGTILDDSDFYPFGGERPVVSSSGNNYKFTGKERDAESGLDNFGKRYYGSGMGRFTSPDPLLVSARRMVNPQLWNMYSYVGVYSSRALHNASYRCNNCGETWIHYFFWWTENKGGGGTFFKAAQYPPLSFDPPAELKLHSQDLDLYKKALMSRNFAFGIGAVAYLRRVVENRMNALLDLVVETAKSSGVSAEKFAGVDTIRESRRFEDKVEFAIQAPFEKIQSNQREGASVVAPILAYILASHEIACQASKGSTEDFPLSSGGVVPIGTAVHERTFQSEIPVEFSVE